jgi:phenylalanyl-tRNA synthetase beta chain
MKVLLSWLREFVPITLETPALCERLSLGGLAVDAVEELGAEIRGVVVGELLGTAPHPQADRLTLCEVRTGAAAAVRVVCGATNMRAGDRVAYAAPGTTLPGGTRIEAATIRGVASAGMLCSAAELGLGEAGEGILILAADAPLGARVGAVLGVEDTLLDLDVTPNRGDCLSILGVAREIGALTDARLLRTRIALRERGAAASEAVSVRIDDPAGCPRYAARLIRGVTIGPSPHWLQRRLLALGVRAINNVVDATNYVMLERGQPLHAFDFATLERSEIVVRRAGATTTLRTLDGVDRALAPDDLLITTGAQPIALAGVMGGAATEVSERTTTVLLESAAFDPTSIRRTARRTELRSEASYRFERGVDVEGVGAAIDRAAELIAQLSGGTIAPGIAEARPPVPAPGAIHLRPKRVEDLLGLSIGRGEMGTILKALGASVSAAPHGAMLVTAPSWRRDLTREIDLIEEIARVGGYARIPATMPSAPIQGGTLPTRMQRERELRPMLIAMGLHEAVTLSFAAARANALFPGFGLPEGNAVIANPINRDEPELRRSLLPGLVAAWRTNRNHGARGLAAYVIGRVFAHDGAPREAWRLAGVLAGELPQHGLGAARAGEFADAKGVVEAVLERLGVLAQVAWQRGETAPFHPGATAALYCGETLVGYVGGLHPEVEHELEIADPFWVFELDIEKLLPYGPDQHRFTELPRFPPAVRDVAVVVDEDFASDRVVHFVRQWRPDLVADVALFDVYVGAPIAVGKKSLAYSVAYRAADRTLTDDEVSALHDELRAVLTRELGVAMRE